MEEMGTGVEEDGGGVTETVAGGVARGVFARVRGRTGSKYGRAMAS